MNDLLLNDDCVLKILEWLLLDDICLLSTTCKRLQALCEKQFRRQCPKEANAELVIFPNSNRHLSVLPSANYIKCFRNFIKNLTIQPFNEQNEEFVSRFANFVKAKCDQILHSICILFVIIWPNRWNCAKK